MLSWFLFAAGVAAYFYLAQQRHPDNPDDRSHADRRSDGSSAFDDAALKPSEDEEVTGTAPRHRR